MYEEAPGFRPGPRWSPLASITTIHPIRHTGALTKCAWQGASKYNNIFNKLALVIALYNTLIIYYNHKYETITECSLFAFTG